ncbi:MAG: DUF983 domain-containing protein [Alphaproteobacteria bacterium]|nr:DUF983 domain-containing protein [Alphaproteobacteria bacterium]
MTLTNPFLAGLRGRCPRCGEGALFAGYLKFADACPACGLDYSAEDAGDGPAVFIMFAVGFIVVPMALVAEVAFKPPLWVHALLWLPLTLGLCAALLRPLRAIMFALQHQHGAAQGRLDGDDAAP